MNTSHALDFLAEAVEQKLAYNTVKQKSAALKYFLRRAGKEDVANDPRWHSFMMGAFKLAPQPAPKPPIWPPDQALSYVAKQRRPRTLIEAGQEALLLLLLATALRIDDVSKLSNHFDVSDTEVRFYFVALRKCPKRACPIENFLLKRFPEDRLCPVQALIHFMDLTEDVRNAGADRLFISSTGNSATTDTLRRWTITILGKAGIRASAGSTRAAAASNARDKNVDINEILSSAGWAQESTFRRFYSREVLPARSLIVAPSD